MNLNDFNLAKYLYNTVQHNEITNFFENENRKDEKVKEIIVIGYDSCSCSYRCEQLYDVTHIMNDASPVFYLWSLMEVQHVYTQGLEMR